MNSIKLFWLKHVRKANFIIIYNYGDIVVANIYKKGKIFDSLYEDKGANVPYKEFNISIADQLIDHACAHFKIYKKNVTS